MLNTLVLLISGITATMGHHSVLGGENSSWILGRVGLGIYFLSLQGIEYSSASFSLARGVYGRVFFFGTGFHGLHVCLGALILLIANFRVSQGVVTQRHHFGLEFSL